MITTTALILILLSAVIHPLWNILLKKSIDKVVFYFHIHFVFTVLFSFILFIFPVGSINIAGWIFIILSSLAHFFYQIFLCRSYELGDISLTYPIIRSSPIFVALLGFIFFREIPTPAAVVGILLVVAGAQLINQDRVCVSGIFKTLKREKLEIILVASMTALFSALYSIVDKKGVLEMSPVLFFYLFFAFSGLLFGAYLIFFKEKRKNFLRVLKKDKYRITLASILEFASYILILYAFRLSKVAYVVALRQVSIIFGVIYGVSFLKEKYAGVRILASLIIFAGVFLITIFG